MFETMIPSPLSFFAVFSNYLKGELKSRTAFSEMALKITLSSILTAEIFNHF